MMKEPTVVIPDSVTIPQLERHDLSNGSRLFVISNGGQGVLRISFVFGAGSSHQTVPFSAGATLNLLSCGTDRYTADQIAELLDFHGSYYDASIDRDYAVVTFCSMAASSAELIDIAAEVILRPTFPQSEIATYCGKRKNALRTERLKPDYLARELFGRTLFGADHPYGITSSEDLYDRLTRNDIVEFYSAHYVAENAFAVISGDASKDDIAAVEGILEALPRRSAPPVTIPSPTPLPFAELSVEGAVQSSIRVGKPMFPRNHPDFVPMQVVATVLGGYFGSRLMQNLRERKGYTYGAYAAMINLQHSGYFVAGAEVGHEHVKDATDQILVELDRLCRKGIDRRELEMVRRMLFGEVMRILDGPFGIADIAIENIQNGTDNHYTEAFVRRIRTITPNEVRSAARRYLADGDFTIVTVG